MKKILLVFLLVCGPAQAATPTFRSINQSIRTVTTANQTVGEPAGCVSGDAEISLALADSGVSLAAPSGWTVLYGPTTQGTTMFTVAWIQRTGSAPNLTWTVTTAGANKYREIHVMCLTAGAGILTALDSQSASGTTGAAIGSPDPPSTTAVASASIAVAGGLNFGSSGSWTASAGYTLRSTNPGGGGADGFLETKALAASGAENPGAAAMSTGSGDGWNGFTVTFKDGGAGGGSTCTPTLTLLGVGRCG
jgi:hypothetical protein